MQPPDNGAMQGLLTSAQHLQHGSRNIAVRLSLDGLNEHSQQEKSERAGTDLDVDVTSAKDSPERLLARISLYFMDKEDNQDWSSAFQPARDAC